MRLISFVGEINGEADAPAKVKLPRGGKSSKRKFQSTRETSNLKAHWGNRAREAIPRTDKTAPIHESDGAWFLKFFLSFELWALSFTTDRTYSGNGLSFVSGANQISTMPTR